MTEPALVPGTTTILEILADIFLGILVLHYVLKSAVCSAAVPILIISTGIQQLGFGRILDMDISTVVSDTSPFLEITTELQLGNIVTKFAVDSMALSVLEVFTDPIVLRLIQGGNPGDVTLRTPGPAGRVPLPAEEVVAGPVLAVGVSIAWPGGAALLTLAAQGEVVVPAGGVGAQPVLPLLPEQRGGSSLTRTEAREVISGLKTRGEIVSALKRRYGNKNTLVTEFDHEISTIQAPNPRQPEGHKGW